MRIVAGRLRGRPVHAPEGMDVRPTSEHVRESVFNILAHAGFAGEQRLRGARVLDAFAGTGAMGLEALSRGAAQAEFMELDPAVRRQLEQNVRALGELENARVRGVDATKPPRATAPCDLILLDPPYKSDLGAPALAALTAAGWAAAGTLAVVELDRKAPFEAPEGWTVEDDRRWGRTRAVFLKFGN
ncbi:MAG: 16S rRNA (guanine(966)-N(2))-methyltransferase RsmD [Acetobacterales bacterium]